MAQSGASVAGRQQQDGTCSPVVQTDGQGGQMPYVRVDSRPIAQTGAAGQPPMADMAQALQAIALQTATTNELLRELLLVLSSLVSP